MPREVILIKVEVPPTMATFLTQALGKVRRRFQSMAYVESNGSQPIKIVVKGVMFHDLLNFQAFPSISTAVQSEDKSEDKACCKLIHPDICDMLCLSNQKAMEDPQLRNSKRQSLI